MIKLLAVDAFLENGVKAWRGELRIEVEPTRACILDMLVSAMVEVRSFIEALPAPAAWQFGLYTELCDVNPCLEPFVKFHSLMFDKSKHKLIRWEETKHE